ncbi:hypothetical protein ABPG77_001090 [Micractinium sp. CCAP 211/92]
MPPKKPKAKNKEASEESGTGAARVPKAVQEAYASYRSKQDDASLETLMQLAFMVRATLWAAEGEAGEAKTAHILQLAVEAATHGVLRYKSAQLLNAALKLLVLTYCSPHEGSRRAAVLKLLQHGLHPDWELDVRGAELDAQVLPLAALEQEPGVVRGPGPWAPEDRDAAWWNVLPLEEWLPPEAECLGSERWPWEFRGGRGASFEEYVAARRADAGSQLRRLAHVDAACDLMNKLESLENSAAGGTAAAAIDGLSKHKREVDSLYRQPIRERLARSPEVLPPERALRLGRELKLRNDQQLDAVARQGPEQGETPAEKRFRQKAALRLQRKAEEAKAARIEAALVRAKVISSFLTLHLPPGAALPDLLALLEREARLPLAVLEAGLERLHEQGVLAEAEVRDLRWQLLYLAEEQPGEGPAVVFRMPPSYEQRRDSHFWSDPTQYSAALEMTALEVGREVVSGARERC